MPSGGVQPGVQFVSGLSPRWEPTVVALAHSLRKQGALQDAVQVRAAASAVMLYSRLSSDQSCSAI